jgi:anti-sigma regulatory factor (Ser/Thr protein kinase)
MTEVLEISLINDLAEISRLAQIVDDFVKLQGLAPHIANKMNLAFDELLTNTISYGFPDDGQHIVKVKLSVENGALIGEIIDDGAHFNPLNKPDPDITLSLEERPIGGLGILFVKKFMDAVKYRREGNLNIITLTKKSEEQYGNR